MKNIRIKTHYGKTNDRKKSHSYVSGNICIFVSFSTMIYFPLVELLNRLSIQVPPMLYSLYNFAIFGISLVYTGFVIVKKKAFISQSEAKGLALEILIIALYFVYGLFFEEDTTYFFYHILWAIPALLVGLFTTKNEYEYIPKLLEPIVIIMGITSFVSASRYISMGVSHLNTLSFGGTNYQGLSYTAAYCVGLELYYVFLSDNKRYSFFCTKVGRTIEIVVGILSAFAVVVSGGRGGLILMLVNIFMFLFIYRKRQHSGTNKIIVLSIVIICCFFVVICIREYNSNSLISDSITRLTSIFNESQNNASYVKSRNEIYKLSLDLIQNKPMLGYGIFNILDTSLVYPHNIILETCLQAGCIYMFFWIIIFISLWKNMINRCVFLTKNYWVLLYLTYSTVFLNVSGTYLWCSQLWFLIGFLCSSIDWRKYNSIEQTDTNECMDKEYSVKNKYIKGSV